MIVAVYAVLYARFTNGVNVAAAPFAVTNPVTLLTPSLSINVSFVRVEPLIYIEKVADIAVSIATLAAPLSGFVEFMVRVTTGGGEGGSGAETVVKFQV